MKETKRVLRIRAAATPAALRRALGQLFSYVRCDLELPTHVAAGQFGGTAALCQVIATWARRNLEETLRTYVSAVPGLRDLVVTDHGLMAVLMAGKVESREGLDLHRDAKVPVAERLAEMHHVSTASRGQKVFLACADDWPDRPATFYDQTAVPTVRSVEGFVDLVSEILRRVVRGHGTRPVPGERTIVALARVLRELFLNTEEWGSTDVSGVRVPASVRFVRVEQHSQTLANYLRIVRGNPLFERYLRHDHLHKNRDLHRLVEISVLDTGPGLPSRHLRREFPAAFREWPYQNTEISPADEYRAVVECLRLHGTASNDSFRGVGLDVVLQLLTALEAILVVRTGRLELYRDFVTKPFERPRAGNQEPYLLDSATQSGFLTKHLPVQGTMFTIIFPVTYDA